MPISLQENELIKGRSAGVLLPLFSMRSATDWGCGDMASFKEWISYFGGEGIKILQILPIHETAAGENCPYTALSAYAIDPVYLSVEDVAEVKNSKEAQELIAQTRDEINYWRSEAKAHFKYIKAAKYKVLWEAYNYFLKEEQAKNTARYQDFLAFEKQHSSWLVPYSIFRTAKDIMGWSSWKHWENNLKQINIAYLKEFATNNSKQMMFFSYVQWLLQRQLEEVRTLAKEKGVLIFGDIPFGVNFDSADVWGNQRKYILNAEVGAPQDQFSKGGQKWGLPAYNWAEVEASNFMLWRAKIKRACEIYDIFRLDHLVGFFRTWIFEEGDEKGRFDIKEEVAQKQRGQKFLEAVIETAQGKLPVGEDLGVIPDYMREYMKEISLPGYRVLRWEKDNEVYREPRNYPVASLCTTSTHDTETLKDWWEQMPAWQRANVWEMVSAVKTDGNVPFTPHVHKAVLRRVMESASCLVIIPVQDIIASTDRINIPGTVTEDNWTYRIDCETAEFNSKYSKEMQMVKDLIKESNR